MHTEQENGHSNGVELNCLVKVHSAANLEELADEIKRSMESADGYSYRCQKTVKNRDGSRRCIYWCCQRSEYAKYKPPVANSSRNRICINRYDCKGYMVLYTPPDTQQQPYLQIQYHHGFFHPQAGNFKVSNKLRTFIKERVNSTNATAKDIYADFIRNKEEFPDDELITQAQIYRWWHTFLNDTYVTDENQILSALNLLNKEDDYQVIISENRPSRFFAFLTPFWRLMKVESVQEVYVDATSVLFLLESDSIDSSPFRLSGAVSDEHFSRIAA
ncbi:hypothetical protein BKA69DRAFT_1123995 [Paraphysoderma sedebokerense]|nr:hypothetical protein BKA69DRAFT_1123995 [Paraphysoderma sedebokerense]